MKKKNIMLGSVVGLFAVALVLSFGMVNAFEFLDNGDIIFTEEEFSSFSDSTILGHMSDNFYISNIKLHQDKIEIDYNLIHIEPTHSNNTYRAFGHDYPTFIELDLLERCLSLADTNTCVELLVTNTEAQTFDLGNNETLTITPTYAQAVDYGLEKYYSALALRDSISGMNTMEAFIANIQ